MNKNKQRALIFVVVVIVLVIYSEIQRHAYENFRSIPETSKNR